MGAQANLRSVRACWGKLYVIVAVLLATGTAALLHAESASLDLVALAKKAKPAVMLLTVYDTSGNELAAGTGFLISADGKLITNLHVVEGGARIVAKAENGGMFAVMVSRRDTVNDIAVLTVEGKDLPFLNLGDSAKAQVGEKIAVIGSPLGLEGTVSEGNVSALREVEPGRKWLQITAPISHGSSGSPVLNAQGEVIGVAAALMQEGQSLNFAVPVEAVKNLLAQKITAGKLRAIPRGEPSIENVADYQACEAAIDKGNYVEALKRAKALVARYPSNSRAYVELGGTYLDMQFYKDGIAACKRAIDLNPMNAEAWWTLGANLGNAGDTPAAIEAFKEAIKIKPDYEVAWRTLGFYSEMEGDYFAASTAYKQALNLEPSDKTLIMQLSGEGKNVFIRSILPEFVEQTKEAIRQSPQSDAAWGKFYGFEEAHNDLSGFVSFYKNVVGDTSLSCNDGNLSGSGCGWLDFMAACEGSGRLSDLIELSKMRLTRHPDSFSVWVCLRDACKKLNGLGELRELAKQALATNPTNSNAWSALTDACSPPEKPDDAIVLAERTIARDLDVSGEYAWQTLCDVYTAHGKQDEFINFCIKYPSNATAVFLTGETQMSRGQLADAATAFRKLTLMYPDDKYSLGKDAWEKLVLVYHREGQYVEAKQAYQALLKLQPDFPKEKRQRLQLDWKMLSLGITNRPPAELRREEEIWQHYIDPIAANMAQRVNPFADIPITRPPIDSTATNSGSRVGSVIFVQPPIDTNQATIAPGTIPAK